MTFDAGTWWLAVLLLGFVTAGLVYLLKRSLFGRIDKLDESMKEISENSVKKSDYESTAAIDVEAQETYLQSQGTDTSEMDETALAQANTGSKVFIASNVKFVDAMEDLKLTCNM